MKGLAVVVDNDPLTRRIVAGRLQRAGFVVTEAAGATEALSRVDELIPDVIVTDIALPRMDGWELIARLRFDKRTARIPIVVVTSGIGLGPGPEGVSRLLVKPNDLARLADEVHAAIAEVHGPDRKWRGQ
jgi:chemosensory pili system protein ChpA (sensor histidine kinase/response regulator)